MLQIVAYCTESVVYMFLFPNRKQIKKLQKSILLQFKLGWGHLSSWRPLSREMLLEFDSWQFQKSLKRSNEFHRRTKHFINSHTQKLISNPLDFTFSIFKKMQPWKSNCRKKHVKDPLTYEIRKIHLEANRASKLANRHQHCIGDETVRAQVSEKFTFPCLGVSFKEDSFQSKFTKTKCYISSIEK